VLSVYSWPMTEMLNEQDVKAQQREVRRRDAAQRMVRTIKEIRAEHFACTAREVERRMRLNHGICQRMLLELRDQELVEWTSLPGSLRLTAKGGKLAAKG